MIHQYAADQHELLQTKITFWFYFVSIPVIVFLLFVLPILRGRAFQFSIFTIAYIAIILVLLYLTYRAYRVMHAIASARCTLTEDTISGVSTPDPFKSSKTFSIGRDEVLGVAKKQINISMTRFFNAVVLNTKDRQYVLFGIENAEQLIQEIQG